MVYFPKSTLGTGVGRVNFTRTQKAANALLGQQGDDLASFVLSRADIGVPGEAIARQLGEATDEVIVVSGQAVRDWIKQFRADRDQAGAA